MRKKNKTAIILNILHAQQCCLCHTHTHTYTKSMSHCCELHTWVIFPAQWHWQTSKTNVLMWSRQRVGSETLSAWMTFSRSCCKRSPAVNWVTELWVFRSHPFPCKLNILLGAPGCRQSPECYLLLCLNSSITRNLWETGWLTVNTTLCCKKLLITWCLEIPYWWKASDNGLVCRQENKQAWLFYMFYLGHHALTQPKFSLSFF